MKTLEDKKKELENLKKKAKPEFLEIPLVVKNDNSTEEEITDYLIAFFKTANSGNDIDSFYESFDDGINHIIFVDKLKK